MSVCLLQASGKWLSFSEMIIVNYTWKREPRMIPPRAMN
jgi:hypothetical protein